MHQKNHFCIASLILKCSDATVWIMFVLYIFYFNGHILAALKPKHRFTFFNEMKNEVQSKRKTFLTPYA